MPDLLISCRLINQGDDTDLGTCAENRVSATRNSQLSIGKTAIIPRPQKRLTYHLQVQILVLRLSHRDPGVTVERHPAAPLAGMGKSIPSCQGEINRVFQPPPQLQMVGISSRGRKQGCFQPCRPEPSLRTPRSCGRPGGPAVPCWRSTPVGWLWLVCRAGSRTTPSASGSVLDLRTWRRALRQYMFRARVTLIIISSPIPSTGRVPFSRHRPGVGVSNVNTMVIPQAQCIGIALATGIVLPIDLICRAD